MDRRVTPLGRVTSPTWGPPPPRKQALSSNMYSTRCENIDSCFSKVTAVHVSIMSNILIEPHCREINLGSNLLFAGVLNEWFVQPLLDPLYYSNITEETDKKWKAEHKGKNVSETVKEYLVKYLGEPLEQKLRY